MKKRIPPEGLKSYVPFHFPYTDGDIREGLEDECGLETWDYWEDEKMEEMYPSHYKQSITGNRFYTMTKFGPKTTYAFKRTHNLLFAPFYYDGDTEKAKFGYVVSTNNSGIYNLNSSGSYEFEIFLNYSTADLNTGRWISSTQYVSASELPQMDFGDNEFQIILEHDDTQGNTVTDLLLGLCAMRVNDTDVEEADFLSRYLGRVRLQCSAWNVSAIQEQDIKITREDENTFDEHNVQVSQKKEAIVWIESPMDFFHLVLRVINNTATVYINKIVGQEFSGNEILSVPLPSNVQIHPSRLKLGGFLGHISNYAFWHKSNTGHPEPPTKIYSSTFNVNEIGGFGTGKDGDMTIVSSASINNFNCCGLVSEVTDARTLQVNSWIGGNSDVVTSEGCEVMIHVTKPRRNGVDEWPYLGMYVFRKIARLQGTVIILNHSIYENTDGFTLSQELADNYYVQVIVVPNYRTFTLNNGCNIYPVKWQYNECGGIIIFRTTGDCTLRGAIITSDYGGVRVYDNHQMSHSSLLNRFLCSRGGGIIIACGGKFTCNSQYLLGVGSSSVSLTNNVGCGCSSNGYTELASCNIEPGKDYINGEEPASHSFSDGNCYSGGACVMLVANTAVINDKAIMTGGRRKSSNVNVGGGGGFCYMAIGELLDE